MNRDARGGSGPRPLRIFISSPSDVAPERLRAALVIEKLQKDYARFFAVSSVLWETEPMLATGHFQDIIDPPSTCDIVALILWSRLGVKLPERTARREYRGIDGRAPVTGTEWEFEEALAAARVKHAPALLVYHKTADPVVSLKDQEKKRAAEEQWKMLDAFWRRHFFNAGQFITAHADFEELDAFERKFEADLRRLIERRIAELQALPGAATAAAYLKGNPFRGLAAFRFEDAPVFFGRAEATKAAVEALIANAEAGSAFLMILGASGAGKSSLANAGVLPALTQPGVVSGVGLWRHAVMRPGGHAEGPFAALAEALVAPDALPELIAPGQDVASLRRHLAAAVEDPAFPILAALNGAAREGRASGRLLSYESARLVLVVDQMEELFTASEAAAQTAFVRCLKGLASCGQVFVLAAMRSDYWHRAAEVPLLAQLAADRGRLDLLPATQAEMTEMIRRPAQAAGLAFEVDPRTEIGLDVMLGEQAANAPGILPLLSFLLEALYTRDVIELKRNVLTYESMRALGGLSGALQNRADEVFASLSKEAQAAFPAVLSALVRVGIGDGEQAVAQRRAPRSVLETAPGAREVIDTFVAARLFVADIQDEGAQGRPDAIIGVTHEALLRAWPRAAQWIKDNMRHLEARARIAAAEALWRHSGRAPSSLLGGAALAEAHELLAANLVTLTPEIAAFIKASQAHRLARRRVRRLQLAAAAATALVAVGSGLWYYDGYWATHVSLHSPGFTRRWGQIIPTGRVIGTQEAKHRNETMKVLTRGRYGPLIAYEFINGHGACAQFPSFGSYFGTKQSAFSSARECRDEISEDGTQERAIDRNGRTVWTFIYSSVDKKRATGEYYDPNGNVRRMVGSGASRLEFTRAVDGPQAGYDVITRYLNDVGRPEPDSMGHYGRAEEYDVRGQLVLTRYLGADNAPFGGRHASSVERYYRNDRGEVIELVFEDADGGRAPSQAWGAASLRYEYVDGNESKVTLLNEQGRPMLGADGWAIRTEKYDDVGDRIETAFLDPFGNLVKANKEGYARLAEKYDDQGRLVEDVPFDADNQPTANNGSPGHAYSYDEKSNVRAVANLDPQGRKLRASDGYAEVVRSYDDHGFIVGMAYFDEADHAAALKGTKVARVAITRDEVGNELATISYDAEGNKTPDAKGVAETRRSFDDRGNEVSESYWDEHGNPVTLAEGYASVRQSFDETGRLAKIEDRGADGRLARTKGGFASITFSYDADGAIAEKDYFDEYGQPLAKEFGCAALVSKREWEGARLRISTSCRDPHGAAIIGPGGFATELVTQDEYGRAVETTDLDDAGKPLRNKDGYATVKTSYDEAGLLAEIDFLNEKGEPAFTCRGLVFQYDKGKLQQKVCAK